MPARVWRWRWPLVVSPPLSASCPPPFGYTPYIGDPMDPELLAAKCFVCFTRSTTFHVRGYGHR